jgi:MYXO-CTERM domain-containing protein
MQKSQANLQNQLESYSLASKALRVPNNWKGGGSMLATVAGSALALATNANAGIIYSGIQNVTASRPAGAGLSVAPFAVGGVPWRLSATNSFGSRRSTAIARLHEIPGNGEGFMFTGPFNVKKLASGAVISAGQSFANRSFPLLRRKNLASYTGQFLNSSVGFAGIEFNLGGVTHYGWIRLHVDIGPGNNSVTATAIDWAYNDVAGQAIHAGEGTTSPTPEPSTASMALLAAGSAGVLAWRRRRKQVAA